MATPPHLLPMIDAQISIHIDGRMVECSPSTTLLEAIRQAGGEVPTLCSTPWFARHGTCRLCLVQVEGGGMVAACHHAVVAGDRYISQSEELEHYRRQTVAFLLEGHPSCSLCPSHGLCRLEVYARRYDLVQDSTTIAESPLAHPLIAFYPNLCIQCGLCRRACSDVQGEDVLGLLQRGEELSVSCQQSHDLEASGCVSCGACLQVCPTRALAPRLEENRAAHRQVTTTCVYCAVGCQLTMEVADETLLRVTPDFHGSPNRGHSCVKGRFGQAFAMAADRLTRPLLRTPQGDWQEIALPDALELIARKYDELRQKKDPYAFAAISSARCTNEENYLLQKFTRVVMGSNSVDNCARVCHSPSAYALGAALGTGAGAYRLEDIEQAGLILLFGANPSEAHPVIGARIRQAVKKGCQLLVVDPRRTSLARLAHLHVAIRPGGNLPFLNAMQQVILTEGWCDQTFLAHHASNQTAWQESLQGCTPEWAAPLCGVDASLIRQAAHLYAHSKKALILWGLGVTESCQGSLTAFALVNLAIITGNLGKPGAGAGPIRGQNNVQGACDMGALPNVFSDYRPLANPLARQEHLSLWGVLPPEAAGYRIGDMWDAALAGRLHMMHVMAQDVVQSDPDVVRVVQALQSLDFLVVQDLFLSETARLASVVLPAASYLEKEGTFVNSDRRIQRVRQVIAPPEGVWSDGALILDIARRMGVKLMADDWAPGVVDAAAIMDEIACLSPNWSAVSYPKLEEQGFLQWPCTYDRPQGTSLLHEGGVFMGKPARLTPTPWQPSASATPEDHYPLLLTTGRMLAHYNVSTMTRRTPIQRLKMAQEERLRIHPTDAQRYGVGQGDRVRVISPYGQVEVKAEISEESPVGVVFMTFHFAETRTNLLIGPEADAITRCPQYKVTGVRLEVVSSAP
ncbi:MAG: formate dehydrogenase subunit alpha [Magnetococcales bacterium]|nr:formate dehydrogenase subunit alpha [Magnetococcales bacterium]NGZ26334.1 formate dehydrogenase subunit alpha [Magnetococcales bacterium]